MKQQQGGVLDDPKLVVELLKHQTELGYRLVTFYTACATAYVALVGVTAQYYFTLLASNRQIAQYVALFAFVISLLSLFAPRGLAVCRAEFEQSAGTYATALRIAPEKFTVVRVGMWLSFAVFLLIAVAWLFLIVQAA